MNITYTVVAKIALFNKGWLSICEDGSSSSTKLWRNILIALPLNMIRLFQTGTIAEGEQIFIVHYGITQNGRDHWRSLVQPWAQSRVSYEIRPSRSGLYPVWIQKNSKDRSGTTSMGNMINCLIVLTVKKFFLLYTLNLSEHVLNTILSWKYPLNFTGCFSRTGKWHIWCINPAPKLPAVWLASQVQDTI